MAPRPGLAAAALAALAAFACVKPNPYGNRPKLDGSRDGSTEVAPEQELDAAALVDRGGVATPPDRPDPAPAPAPDAGAGADLGSDRPLTECTPSALDCNAEGTAIRTCNEQGRWILGPSCGPQTACTAGVCLCTPGTCDEGSIREVPGRVETLTGSGSVLFLAVTGPGANIRRFDVPSRDEQTVHTEAAGIARFALDADPMGKLLWCSDVRSPGGDSGQLSHDGKALDPMPCLHVRAVGDLIYYKGQELYRRRTDGSPRETLSAEPMTRFELQGDHLYFIGAAGEDAFLKRFALADPGKVETLLYRPDAIFRQLAVDGTHVYVVSDDRLLRVPLAGSAQPEDVRVNNEAEVWAVALGPSHVYFSTTTPDLIVNGCSRTQVWRRPKSGGLPVSISTTANRCAGELFILGAHLYTPIFTQGVLSVGPSQVLRIRL